MSTTIAAGTRLIGRLGDHAEAIGWSPDSRFVAVGSLAGDVEVLDAAGGTPLASLPGHPFGTTAVAWSPDGTRLVSGGQDGIVRTFDVPGGAVLGEVRGRGWVSDLVWRPGTSTECAAAIGRQVVRIGADGDELSRTDDHPSTVTSLAWTPDGRRLAAGAYGGLWWYEEGSEAVRHFDWKGAVLTVAVAPNGKYVASGNQDNSVHCWKLWSADDFQMSGYELKIQHLAWSRDSRFLAVAGLGDVTLWDFSGRGPQGTTPKQLSGHANHLVAVGYRPVGPAMLMTAAADGRVCLWQPGAGKRSLIGEVSVGEAVGAAKWAPDGAAILVTTALGGVFVVDVA